MGSVRLYPRLHGEEIPVDVCRETGEILWIDPAFELRSGELEVLRDDLDAAYEDFRAGSYADGY